MKTIHLDPDAQVQPRSWWKETLWYVGLAALVLIVGIGIAAVSMLIAWVIV